MPKQTKILIIVLVGVVVLISGFYIYNKLLIPKKTSISEKLRTREQPIIPEETGPKLIVSAPVAIETVAYKPSLFNVLIENEKGYQEAKDVNITLRGIIGTVSLSYVNISQGESKNFEVKLDGLEPGDYTLYLDINGKPDINISKTILIKSQIVVGLDGYHLFSDIWKGEKGEYSEADFVKYLNENNIKTTIIDSKFSSEILEKLNVLIVETPEQPFSSIEKQELRNFLNKKGGLLLVGAHSVFGSEEKFVAFLNDLADSFHLEVKFARSSQYIPAGWTKEITKHPVTSGVEEVWCRSGYPLEIDIPMIPLVKREGGTIYAVQQYAKGKIGIIRDADALRISPLTSYEPECPQCNQLNLNLIKWLATPPTAKELEEMG